MVCPLVLSTVTPSDSATKSIVLTFGSIVIVEALYVCNFIALTLHLAADLIIDNAFFNDPL